MLNNCCKKISAKDLKALKRAKDIANDAHSAMLNLFFEMSNDLDETEIISEICDLSEALESIKSHADLMVSHAKLINRYNDMCNHD